MYHSSITSADADLRARLDRVLACAIDEERVVGAVLMVARHGELVYATAAGLADREAERPMREGDVFRFASLTKPLVSATALALVERGRLALDAPVTDWLPDFRPALPDGARPTIAIHHLLTHTAGLDYRFNQPDGPYRDLNVSDGLDQPGLGLAENLARLREAPLLYAPGTGWRYSLAIDVLGAVLEKAVGKPLPDLVAEFVTGPLGMTETRFTASPDTLLVTPYGDASPRPVRMGDTHVLPFWDARITFAPGRAYDPASYPSGGAGMIGTAPDFLRFLEAIREGGAPILEPATVEQMTTLHVPPEQMAMNPGWGFGYGGSVLADPATAQSPQSAGTLSWGGVYGHNWFIDRKNGITSLLMTNTALEGMVGPLTIEVRDAVYGVRGVRPSSSPRQLCIDVVDTPIQNAGMSKLRASSSSDPKGSINLRIEAGTRQLIDDAAALLGKTRTEFMVESARQQAIDVLLDQRLFALEPERYDAFMAALDNPPAPGLKLKALLRRVPAWQK